MAKKSIVFLAVLGLSPLPVGLILALLATVYPGEYLLIQKALAVYAILFLVAVILVFVRIVGANKNSKSANPSHTDLNQ